MGNYSFEKNFLLAEDYYITHGHLNVPLKYETENGVKLGVWLRNLRWRYDTDKLDKTRIERLEKIGMQWTNVFNDNWEKNYNCAKIYYEENGHLNIPFHYKTSDGIALGLWIRRHRQDEKTQKTKIKLTKERKEKLDNIGMIWTTEEPWDKRYNLVKKYYEEHGDYNIPSDYTAEGIRLGQWFSMQKKNYSGQGGNKELTAEQIKKLDLLGINIESPEDLLFNEYFAAAESFFNENGHLDVPKKYIVNNGNELTLRSWLGMQRKLRRANKLSDDKIEKLTAMGMQWESVDLWELNFSALKKYIESNKSYNIPVSCVTDDGVDMGNWLAFQRRKYNDPEKYGKLSKVKVKRLEDLGISLAAVDAWSQNFRKVENYYRLNGNIDIPNPFITDDGCDLGYWFYCQISAYREGRLSKDKVAKFESLNINWLNAQERRWENNYEKLTAYKQKYGTLIMNVTYRDEDGFALGKWVRDQRMKKAEGKLTSEQIQKLDELGFDWNKQLKNNSIKSQNPYIERRNDDIYTNRSVVRL